ncbi:DUF262 domain-containing protein [Nostoc sp. TCL26-01]|uniref:GmrSD restriction endonuclease domain-containing protein n=1 Tax=Nostoc sp. TCL26-01 TaxID=2576904 RepID=UPI0015B9330B|nr:DUF262 domain-containing protein [Nostoc sp. TCL26-01]QLE59120.1 DUF262 domain-containing protein [Nostoc sp. TCL26-01]
MNTIEPNSKAESLSDFMDEETSTQNPENWENEENEIIPFKYSITSYGADYPVDSLVKRLENGSIYIPSLQRRYVWKLEQASRFIESLLLGLPVPGIFLSKEKETQKLLVIDGQQRLRTLQSFYTGLFQDNGNEKKFTLKNVQLQFEGLTYNTLPHEDRRRLDDSIIHATIVNQDEPSEDDSSIYHIFQRLNTGGTRLESQEIRSSIYHGEFNDLLKELNQNSAWRSIYGKDDKNLRDEELILRFIALYFKENEYKKPMKNFLNNFMGKNRHLKCYSSEQIRSLFETTINKIYQCIGDKAFKPKKVLNASVFDAVMIGVARRLEKGNINDCEDLKSKYTSLLENQNFLAVTVNTARTSEEKNIENRIRIATNTFAEVE